jgi:hypothetical protein
MTKGRKHEMSNSSKLPQSTSIDYPPGLIKIPLTGITPQHCYVPKTVSRFHRFLSVILCLGVLSTNKFCFCFFVK